MAEYFEPKTYGEQVLRGLGYTGGFGAGGAQSWLNSNQDKKTQYDTTVASNPGGAWATATAPAGIQPMTVSSMNDYQKSALYDMGQPYKPVDPRAGSAYDAAFSAAQTTGKPFDYSAYSNFMNPYIDTVVNRNADSIRRQYDVDRNASKEAFAASGGFGSTAQGTAEAQITEAQNRQIGDMDAGLRLQGFDTAQNNAFRLYDTDNANSFARASVYGGIGDRYMNLDQYGRNIEDTSLDRRLFAGDRVQGQNQAELDAYYFEKDRAAAYPYNQLNFLTGQIQAYPTGSTTTNSTPGNPISSAVGGGLLGYGIGQQFENRSNYNTGSYRTPYNPNNTYYNHTAGQALPWNA